jgi:hypothetical protein
MTTGVIHVNSTYLDVVEDLVDCILFRVRFLLSITCSLPDACKGTDDRPVGFQFRLFNDTESQSSNSTVCGLTIKLTKSLCGSEKR